MGPLLTIPVVEIRVNNCFPPLPKSPHTRKRYNFYIKFIPFS